MRVPTVLALILAITAAGFYGISTWIERTSPDIALKRFESAIERGDHRDAAAHGERLLTLWAKQEPGSGEINQTDFQLKLANAQRENGNFRRSAALLEQLLTSQAIRTMAPANRLVIEADLARSQILNRDYSKGISIIASFLELAGDAAINPPNDKNSLPLLYGKAVRDMADVFANTMNPAQSGSLLVGDPAGQLATANQMVALGSFYSLYRDDLYAAAGLLSTAYEARRTQLPEHARDLTHIALILAPIYNQMKRFDDAERLLLRAFHAQETIIGSQTADASRSLSLYIKSLADVYETQGRQTEADALRAHLRKAFAQNRQQSLNRTASAISADKSAANLRASDAANDPISDITRPVWQSNVVPVDYRPDDLVAASSYRIPVNRQSGDNEQITVRLANEGERDANMPIRLVQLMTMCAGSVKDEALSLVSGYESRRSLEDAYQADQDQPGNVAPGLSEHQLGLAVDVQVNGRLMRPSDESWMCFRENAFEFGFILSLPQGNDYVSSLNSFEPWHWRFVGPDIAALYRELGPVDRPQEFLANLPCYIEQARLVSSIISAETICLETQKAIADAAQDSSIPNAPPGAPLTLISSDNERGLASQSGKRLSAEKAVTRALDIAPKFSKRGRFYEAHTLYAGAVTALEDLEGSNRPELSFLIGLLADNYERRGLLSHAAALRAHMATIFEREIAENDQGQSSTIDLTSAIRTHHTKRPVTRTMPLQAKYIPDDLVAAVNFDVPVSKDPRIDEMKIRIAADTPPDLNSAENRPDADAENKQHTMPARLGELLEVCAAQSEGNKLSLRSGYRSYSTQADLYSRLRHRGTVTPPGMSEHQTGLAVDIDVNGDFMREADAAYACFQDTAHHFGFILSYPKGNKYLPGEDTFEPWHWRYVGIQVARLFHESGPRNRPQEFLAALDCYQQQEEARATFLKNDLKDYCLYEDPTLEATDIERAEISGATFPQSVPTTPAEEIVLPDADPARILNTPLRSGKSR